MSDSESIKEIGNQVAMQTATAVKVAFNDTEQHPSQPQCQTIRKIRVKARGSNAGKAKMQLGHAR